MLIIFTSVVTANSCDVAFFHRCRCPIPRTSDVPTRPVPTTNTRSTMSATMLSRKFIQCGAVITRSIFSKILTKLPSIARPSGRVMMTSSNGDIFRVSGPLCGEFTGHRCIPLTKASDAEPWCFLWSAPCINGSVNNREAGDLRRHRSYKIWKQLHQPRLWFITGG